MLKKSTCVRIQTQMVIVMTMPPKSQSAVKHVSQSSCICVTFSVRYPHITNSHQNLYPQCNFVWVTTKYEMRNLKNRCYLTATISNLLTNKNSSLEVYDGPKKNHMLFSKSSFLLKNSTRVAFHNWWFKIILSLKLASL